MTAPRQVLPGTTYLVTRRCAQRQFLLRPSKLTSQVFGYVLAVAARRHDIRVHAFCVMSNHVHMVVTDPHARLPAFKQMLDSLVARCLNAALGRGENFWAPNSYSAVALSSRDSVIDKASYVLANPVLAGLVASGRDWPGLWSCPEAVGARALEFSRPAHFFRVDGSMPERATLEVSSPPGFLDDAEFRKALSRALADKEGMARRQLAAAGRRVLGIRGVMAQRPTAQPRSRERRGAIVPRVAGRDKWKRIEALARLVEFLQAYRRALVRWRAAIAGVVFPAGTYLVRITHGVQCEAPF
jgi:REP element-mobilizing transposase RayT